MLAKLTHSVYLIWLLGLASGAFGWTSRDIGGGPAKGHAAYDDATGIWTVQGGGADIWGTSDAFHYVYKYLRGNGSITARVLSVGGPATDEWRKAGVMMREDLTPESEHATTFVTGQNYGFIWRATTGLTTYGLNWRAIAGLVGCPYWVRVERVGDAFAGYLSPDGLTWTQVTEYAIDMRDKAGADVGCYIGLAVTSRQSDTLCEAKFDNVTLVGQVSDEPPLQLTAWNPIPANGAAYVTTPFVIWRAGDSASWHDLYFGTNPTPGAGEHVGRQSAAEVWRSIHLDPGTTYYWRVDEIDPDGTTYNGDLWSFTAAPYTAYDPDPPDGAKHINPDSPITWFPGVNARSHNVYLGTDKADVANSAPDTFKGNQPYIGYGPGPLVEGTTYYWRIDEVEAGNIKRTGEIWSFETLPDIPIADPSLVGWWKLDAGSGTTAPDWSGHGNDGTLIGDPQWVAGRDGGALELDGRSYVELPTGLVDSQRGSVALWIKTTQAAMGLVFYGADHPWGAIADGYGDNPELHINMNCSGSVEFFMTGSPSIRLNFTRQMNDDDWNHIAATWDEAGGVSLHLNGTMRAWSEHTGGSFNSAHRLRLGRADADYRYYRGLIDDVQLYNRPLQPAEIQQAMRGNPAHAWAPKPADKSTVDTEKALPLTWVSGAAAVERDVYFGTSRAAVTDADASDTAGTYRGRQDPNSYAPDDALETGRTYYWRVDEIGPDAALTTGRVWSFTVPDYRVVDDFEQYDDYCNRVFYPWADGWGHSGQTACGVEPFAGNDTGSTVGYVQAPYAEQTIVHEGTQSMPLKYINNGSTGKALYSETTRAFGLRQDWTTDGVKALTLHFRGPPIPDGSHSYDPSIDAYTVTGGGADIWNVPDFPGAGIGHYHDEFHYVCKRLSGDGEIRAKVCSITYANVWAKAGVMIRETLDPNSANALMSITAAARTHFQNRVTSGYDSAAAASQPDAIVVPHWVRLEREGNTFTAYHSSDGVNWLLQPGNQGSAWPSPNPQTIHMAEDVYIGLAVTAHNADPTVVCTALFSDVTVAGDVTGQWQSQDIGIARNSPEQLYVAVEDGAGRTKVVNHPDPNLVQSETWQQWNIDLKQVSDDGVNLTDIRRIHIGLGNRDDPTPGGAGTLYIDDIRLYRPRCLPSIRKPDGDFSRDCVVDHRDIEILAGEWLLDAGNLLADLNGDSRVGFEDFAGLTNAWREEYVWP